MGRKDKKLTSKVLYDECTILPKAKGNGQLVRRVSVGAHGIITRYSLAYINYGLCRVDNDRVLGYDNAHGYHHRHYMGTIEPVNFINFEQTEEQFQKEFEVLYAVNPGHGQRKIVHAISRQPIVLETTI
jgi:hypothetical protein